MREGCLGGGEGRRWVGEGWGRYGWGWGGVRRVGKDRQMLRLPAVKGVSKEPRRILDRYFRLYRQRERERERERERVDHFHSPSQYLLFVHSHFFYDR